MASSLFRPSPLTPPLLVLAAVLPALAALPARAHGLAQAGPLAGLLHPLLGLDHLLLLLGVGAAAASLSPSLLLWALAGGVVGGFLGAVGGGLPLAELLAALAVTAVATLVLRGRRSGSRSTVGGAAASLIAVAVAVHALLHGQEAPGGAEAIGWWLGALLASAAVAGGSTLVLRRLPRLWLRGLAAALALAGGFLALGPLALALR